MKTAKIAIVSFPLNDVGGIDSWCINIITGFRRLGHTVQLYHATPKTRYKCDPEKPYQTKRYTVLPGLHLGYRDELLDDNIEALNQYDLVIFLHPAPHPTSENMNYPDIYNWKELYKRVHCRKLMIFHDALWEKTNDWIDGVADHVDGVMAAQHHFMPAVERYLKETEKSLISWWEYFPLDVPPRKDYKDYDNGYGIVATQWLAWKNHRKFLPMLADVKPRIHFFGAGIEYHYAVRDGDFQKYGVLDATKASINEETTYRHVYWGFVPYAEVLNRMSTASFSIDLSTRGYTNMTHWEPLLYGTVSMMSQEVFDDEFNEIPRECTWVYEFDKLPQEIEMLMGLKGMRKDIAKNGYDFVKDTCDCEKVAERILENML